MVLQSENVVLMMIFMTTSMLQYPKLTSQLPMIWTKRWERIILISYLFFMNKNHDQPRKFEDRYGAICHLPLRYQRSLALHSKDIPRSACVTLSSKKNICLGRQMFFFFWRRRRDLKSHAGRIVAERRSRACSFGSLLGGFAAAKSRCDFTLRPPPELSGAMKFKCAHN